MNSVWAWLVDPNREMFYVCKSSKMKGHGRLEHLVPRIASGLQGLKPLVDSTKRQGKSVKQIPSSRAVWCGGAVCARALIWAATPASFQKTSHLDKRNPF